MPAECIAYSTPAGVHICFSPFPGFRLLRGSTTGLPYTAPHRGSGLGSVQFPKIEKSARSVLLIENMLAVTF